MGEEKYPSTPREGSPKENETQKGRNEEEREGATVVMQRGKDGRGKKVLPGRWTTQCIPLRGIRT